MTTLPDFALERYFARWEFAVRHVLCASDVEGMPMAEVLALADDETRAMWQGLRLGYTESLGHPALRAEIAALYETVAPDDVITFAGAEEGIFLAMHALLGAGDHAVVVWPAYQSLRDVARSVGADVTLVDLRPEDWSLDLDAVRDALRPNTRVLVVNFPHNPTGAMLPRADFDTLVHMCDERGITLFSDEVYRFLEVDARDRLPAAADVSANAVSLGVMSKSFALAGLRVGWIATRNRALIDRLARLKDYTTICNSAPSEVLALIALRARESVLARSRAIVARNLPVLDDFFARMSEQFRWVRPRAGSCSFPELLHGRIDDFADELVREEGVLLLPASRFGYASNHFRVGLGRSDLPVALEKVERFALRSSASA